MTVDELRAMLEGVHGDREVTVRVQGVNRPVEGVFTESEQMLSAFGGGEVTEVKRLILSDRRRH